MSARKGPQVLFERYSVVWTCKQT